MNAWYLKESCIVAKRTPSSERYRQSVNALLKSAFASRQAACTFVTNSEMEPVTSKTVLGLHMPTDPRWVDLAAIRLEDILTDHAYCEQKAATACISLIQTYPDRLELVEELAPVVTEEWGHFRMVLQELNKRGLHLGRQRKDEYVNRLLAFQRKGGSAADRLVEKLLTCALIEARSCERFRLLSLEIPELPLRDFYRKFMIAEAGHYRLFLELARLYGDPAMVNHRWQEYRDFEAAMLPELEVRGDRMH
jgi:tRNA 2-(methylsulfanyl)-N6-isopentenyladenosine37 hydroxylase